MDAEIKKMTAAEAGRKGGLVTAPRAADYLRGNPAARRLAVAAAKSDCRESKALYELDPDVLVLLAEFAIERLSERSIASAARRAQRAAFETVSTLASFEWEEIHLPDSVFRPFYLRLEIGAAAQTLRKIFDSGFLDESA